MYYAFLSIHTLTVSILVCYHFKNHLSPCNNLTFFTDIKNKNDLCHILDFLKCLFMLILLFSCGSKFTTKSTMQENSHTNISLHFSECQISPSLLFCFYSIYKFNKCHDLWKALLNFLLILFLCNTFIKKNYFHFFFSYISNETQNFHWNICMWFHFLHGCVNCWTSCVYLNGLYILF